MAYIIEILIPIGIFQESLEIWFTPLLKYEAILLNCLAHEETESTYIREELSLTSCANPLIQVEIMQSYGASNQKAVVKNADMTEEMQQKAVDCAQEAMEKYNIEKDIAAHIKKTFDSTYNPTWHCIVGRNFGRWDGNHVDNYFHCLFLKNNFL